VLWHQAADCAQVGGCVLGVQTPEEVAVGRVSFGSEGGGEGSTARCRIGRSFWRAGLCDREGDCETLCVVRWVALLLRACSREWSCGELREVNPSGKARHAAIH